MSPTVCSPGRGQGELSHLSYFCLDCPGAAEIETIWMFWGTNTKESMTVQTAVEEVKISFSLLHLRWTGWLYATVETEKMRLEEIRSPVQVISWPLLFPSTLYLPEHNRTSTLLGKGKTPWAGGRGLLLWEGAHAGSIVPALDGSTAGRERLSKARQCGPAVLLLHREL